MSKVFKESVCVGFCPYCGCGCRLVLKMSEDGSYIEKTLPDTSDPVSRGKPCIKGITVHEMLRTKRLDSPMIRLKKGDKLQRCTWDEAFSFIAQKLEKMAEVNISKDQEGRLVPVDRSVQEDQLVPVDRPVLATLRDKVYFVGSGETTNEANYLLSKLCRSVFWSNNIDSCARLCHAATGVGFDKIFGIKAIPRYSMDDLQTADCFLFVGTDPMEDYPVLFNRVLEAKSKRAKIVCVDLAGNGTTSQADRFLKISPGGIIPLLSHLIIRLVDGGDISRDAKSFDGYSEFVESARKIADSNPVSSFGFSRDDMEYLYWTINDAKKLVIGFGMGLTQHLNGTQNVCAITGLAVLLNAILFPGRGKINVQGAGDVGSDPNWRPVSADFPGYKVSGWHEGFRKHRGVGLTKGLYSDDVKFVWVVGGNPSQSMPDLNKLDKSFEKKFIVYQHCHPSRTMEFADVVLPARVLSEEAGSVTNGERRVRGILKNRRNTTGNRKVYSKDSSIKSNVDIISAFAKSLGVKGFQYGSVTEIFDELVKVTPDYNGLSVDGVYSDEGQFANKEPRHIHFQKLKYDPVHFSGAGEYPFVLTSARNRFHFCTGDGTRRSKTLVQLAGPGCVLINTDDARIIGIKDNSRIRLISKVGVIEVEVKTDPTVEKRVVVAPFHFEKILVNKLTPLDLDPESGTPCYKNVPVRIEVVS